MGAGAKMAVFRVSLNGCAFLYAFWCLGLGPCYGQTAQQRGAATAGLPIAQSVIADRDQVQRAHVMALPYVVKPNNEGSSVGFIVNEDANSPPHLSDVMPDTVMVEAYLAGRELTTTVMGDRALGVTEIFTDGWYDYDAKYADGGSYTWFLPIFPTISHRPAWILPCAPIRFWGAKASAAGFRWDETCGRDGLFLLETHNPA